MVHVLFLLRKLIAALQLQNIKLSVIIFLFLLAKNRRLYSIDNDLAGSSFFYIADIIAANKSDNH